MLYTCFVQNIWNSSSVDWYQQLLHKSFGCVWTSFSCLWPIKVVVYGRHNGATVFEMSYFAFLFTCYFTRYFLNFKSKDIISFPIKIRKSIFMRIIKLREFIVVLSLKYYCIKNFALLWKKEETTADLTVGNTFP